MTNTDKTDTAPGARPAGAVDAATKTNPETGAGAGAATTSQTQAEASETPDRPKVTVATTWLDGCSGCHMSILDLDERLLQLAELADIVYSPLVDCKELPETVDVGIIEGAVSTEEDLEKARMFRRRCQLLVSLGDCAVSANVPSMRNTFALDDVLDRAFVENAQTQPQHPSEDLPHLLPISRPLHAVVPVDLYVQGCPPSADTIWYVLEELIAGRVPDPTEVTRFGA